MGKSSDEETREGAEQNEAGLAHYASWELDRAIGAFKEATIAEPENPEYHLNLARAYARNGSYPEAMRSLGNYLHSETDEDLAGRYERLFSSALDEVEQQLIESMGRLELSVQLIGKAIQMWLEYRLTVGRKPMPIAEPRIWAAAICLAVCRVNFIELSRLTVATEFNVDPAAVKERYDLFLSTLDLIPADYRYFASENNPLDKLYEAAQAMDEMYRVFREE